MGNRGVHGSIILLLASLLALSGCRSGTVAREQSRRGAGYGALTGGVSGFFFGLLRGRPIQGAAEGAVVGAGTGAVVGGIHGSAADRELKAEYGDLNHKALMALVHRDYPAAREYTAQTADDPNPKHRHVSAWISALIAKETLGKDALGPYYDTLIGLDNDIDTREDARVELRLAERDLRSLRKQFGTR